MSIVPQREELGGLCDLDIVTFWRKQKILHLVSFIYHMSKIESKIKMLVKTYVFNTGSCLIP